MKKQSQFSSKLFRRGALLFACCQLANGTALRAQNAVWFSTGGAPPPDGTNITTRAGTGFGLVINGSDIGTILLKTCDLDQDGKVTSAELKTAAAAYFKQWDTNADGYLSSDELSAAIKALFPAPPPGAAHAVRMINGVATEVPPGDLPKPDAQVAKHLLAGADANQDGFLSLQEIDDFLDKNFSQWDQNGDGGLDASELNAAFGQFAMPDVPGVPAAGQ